MPKFQKKPIIIEAHQWWANGSHPLDGIGHISPLPEGKLVRFFRDPSVPDDTECQQCGYLAIGHGWIDTLEGGHRVCPGDWIITGIQGEHYPCKPEIFKATYEQVFG